MGTVSLNHSLMNLCRLGVGGTSLLFDPPPIVWWCLPLAESNRQVNDKGAGLGVNGPQPAGQVYTLEPRLPIPRTGPIIWWIFLSFTGQHTDFTRWCLWNISEIYLYWLTYFRLGKIFFFNVIISIGDGVGKWTFYNILIEVVQTCYSYFFL